LIDNFDPNGNSYRECLTAIERTKALFDFSHLLNIAAKAKPNGANDSAYIQCKAFEKVLKFIKAIAYKDFRMLDNHTRSITINAMLNSGVISSKGAFATLVRVEFDELSSATSEVLKARNGYSAGTGSTQLSSTRELFRILGLCDGIKGAKDAPIIFTEEAKAHLIEHFEQIAQRTNVALASDEEEASEEASE
jgi:hypothetical protein